MKNYLSNIFIAIAFIPFITNAQDVETEKKERHLMIGIHASPEMCYRTLVDISDNNGIEMIIDDRNKYEEFKVGYRAGISACYKFSKSFAIEAGLEYSHEGYRSTGTGFTYGDMIDSRYGFLYPAIPYISSIYPPLDYNYINLPLRGICYFGKNKSLLCSIGLTTGFLLKTSYEKEAYNSEDLNTIGLSPTFSFGYEPSLNSKTHLRFESQLKYNVLKVVDGKSIATYLWSAGISISYFRAVR